MTDLEVIRGIINRLDSINVPVGLTQQIAVPIAQSSAELKALHNAIIDALKKKKEEDQNGNGDVCQQPDTERASS